MQFGCDWEDTLNDIEELIQSELGCAQGFHWGTEMFGPQTEVQGLSRHVQGMTNEDSTEWHFTGRTELPSYGSWGQINSGASIETLQQPQMAIMAITPEPQNNYPEVNIEIQILDLKDFYDKKTKKGANGLEYRLENSEVTVVVQASAEITEVYVHVQRCAKAAIRTHDTTGPVELDVRTLKNEKQRRVICVDLGSVYKKQDGDHVYWLERADVAERNKWELIITIELMSGLTASLTSKPFRVTTKVNYKRGADYSSVCKVQNLSCKFSAPHIPLAIKNTGVSPPRESGEVAKLGVDTTIIEDNTVSTKLSRNLLQFNLAEFETNGISVKGPLAGRIQGGSNSLKEDRIILQPNTALKRQMVASHYSCDPRVRCVMEQPELAALLKLVKKRSVLLSDRRKKTKGTKTAGENVWWACGHCFFERNKKSTIRAHIIQGICQKQRMQRRILKRTPSVPEIECLPRSTSETSELHKYKSDSSKRSLSF